MIASLPRSVAARLRNIRFASRRRSGVLTAAAARAIAERLGAEKTALFELTASLEEEFLGLGGRLRKITVLARQLQERSGEVISAAAGRSEGAAIQFAFQLLKKAEDLVHASREQYETVFAVFESMRVDLARIARERKTLLRTLAPLESTNTQFRIQACSFDEATREQFFGLADAIAAIARDVGAAVGQRFEELEATGRATTDLAARLASLASDQKRETDAMLARTRAHLASLGGALAAAETAAESVSQTGEKVARGVSKAIMALQCQDMARQKFQHIGAAIDQMIAHVLPETGGGPNEDADEACHFLPDAARVQRKQLDAVFEQLDKAAHQVEGGLLDLDEEARSFAERALRSGDAALDGKMIAAAIESIRGVLAVIDNAVESIRGVVELVGRLKLTFSDCTSQILDLALRLRMVALNAQVFASHVETGAALEVVARNTRNITDNAMEELEEISSRVARLVESVVDLEQRLGDYRELAVMEQNLLTGEARESETRLRALEQSLGGSVAALGPLEQELSESIRQTSASIRFPEAIARARSRSIALFEKVAANSSQMTPGVPGSAHYRLRELQQNYTMAHERSLHESALAEAGVSAAPDWPPAGQAAVELREESGSELALEAARGGDGESEVPAGDGDCGEGELAGNIELF